MHPALRRYLTSLRAAGVRRLPRPEAAAGNAADLATAGTRSAQGNPPGAGDRAAPSPTTRARAAAPPSTASPARAPDLAPPASGDGAGPAAAGATELDPELERFFSGRPRPAADPAAVLATVAGEVAGCEACGLCRDRTHAVPGEGDPRARVVFVGEGPGADEDRTGRPFVGRAGQLLDAIITKGMGLRREDVYICNAVKCRPPGNRTPTPDEVAACGPFLERQLLAIAPAVICTLGATATRILLDTDQPMGRLRGRQQIWRGIPVIPTYHPAYLLRNPAAKRPTWEDIQRVMELSAT